MGTVWDTLLRRNLDGSDKGHLVERSEILDDKSRWRLHLKRGVTFSNGEPFTAEAVDLLFQRRTDPKISDGALAYFGKAKEFVIVDDHTIDIKTKGVDRLMLDNIADFFHPMAPTYFKEQGADVYAEKPIGTGPFLFKEWVKGDRVVFEANPKYWGGPPRVETITFKIIQDAATLSAALLAGEVHIIEQVGPAQIQQLKSSNAVRIEVTPGANIAYLQLGGRWGEHPVLKDKRVREAINYALNKEAIIQTALGGYGTVASTYGWPPKFGIAPELKPYPYDPEKAKQLLKEAGQGDGFKLTLLAHTRPPFPLVVQAVQGDLAKVGIQAEIESFEFNTLLAKMFKHEPFDAWLGGTGDQTANITEAMDAV